MIFWLSIILLTSTCIKETLIARKIFWAPIYGICNEGLWITFFLMAAPQGWPILFACGYYILNYSLAIPRWLRDRADSKAIKQRENEPTISWEKAKFELGLGENDVPTKENIE